MTVSNPTVDVGQGTTITFPTSGWTAEITKVAHGGLKRQAHSTAHMATAAPTGQNFANEPFIPGRLTDPGELTIEGHYNPDTIPPVDAPAETITVRFPLKSGLKRPAMWRATGFMTEFDDTVPHDGLMGFTAKVKLSGSILKIKATTSSSST